MSSNGRVISIVSAVLFVLSGWCGTFSALPVQAATSQKKPPGLHYVFAHQYLPRALFANPQLGLGLALSYNREKALLSLWNHCQKNASEPQKNDEPTGLAITGGTTGSNTAIAVITMPQPREMADAYYVCVVTTFAADAGGEPRAADIAYYTLEKTVSLTPPSGGYATAGQPEPVPTILGKWDKKGGHANFGPGPAPDSPNEFVAAVLKLHTDNAR